MRTRATCWATVGVALILAGSACSSSTKTTTSPTSASAAPSTSAPASTQTSGAVSSTDQVLGAVHPATGDPVLIGMISNGKTTTGIDNIIEFDVANAAVKWLNERKGGIGGRPIKLVTCTDEADPGKAVDCANSLISQNVTAVVIGSSAVVESEWQPLHDAHVPVFAFGATGKLVKDPDSTFGLTAGSESILAVPVQAAKDKGVTKVTAIVIDVPAATSIYKSAAPAIQAQEGVTIDLVPVPIGTPDMTPQVQKIMSQGDPGIINVLGNDTFCIAAFNALRAVGFKGTVTTAAPCITDATRKAVPGSFLSGMQLSYSAPVGDTSNPSYTLYKAVVDTYGGGKSIDLSRTQGWGIFLAINGFQTALQGISGPVTSSTMVSTIKKMPWTELPGGGGLHFRCNGKADPTSPASCLTGTLVSSLDGSGNPTTYKVIHDTQIPD
jgi:branched-chain amino acid transport system substrate-binding protein